MAEFLEKWKKYLTFSVVLSSFVNILQMTFSFYMFTIYRNVIISYSGYSLSNITIAAVFALTFFGLFHYLRSRLLAAAGRDLNQTYRALVYKNIVGMFAISPQQTYSQGLNDLQTLKQYFSTPAVYALMDAPWSPFYLALIFTLNSGLGTIATVGALVMAGLSMLQERLIRRQMTDANRINHENMKFVTAFLKNAEVINGMGMTEAIGNRFDTTNRAVIRNQTVSSVIAGTIQAVIKPMQNVIQVFIYCFGAYYVITQGFDTGLMVACSIIMGRGLAPLMQVSSTWRVTLQAREAYQRFSNFVRAVERLPERMALPTPKGHVQVDRAGLVLGGRPLLHNVSFQLAPGEFLGIVGPNGAGKTTLCRMLLGIWPAQTGQVMLDGNKMFLWDKEALGAHIGYLPQEVELFDSTVARNIARMGEPDPAKVEQAAEICGLKELIETLPQGMDTQLEGDSGITLSGGQRQRLCLARALYDDPTLLIMDEPTANLDEPGEQAFVDTISRLKKEGNCTGIMVTHKPSLLQTVDKILVLQQGTVALFGPRDQVFQKLAQQKQGVQA